MRDASACVDIETLVVGMLENNVYIIGDEKATFVVDPSCKVEKILQALHPRKLDAIILTHKHFDHIGAANDLREATGATVIASVIDAPYIENKELVEQDIRNTKPCPVDQKVSDGDIVEIGSMAWKVIATPGHTQGGICLFLDPRFGLYPGENPVLISGDTLFRGTVGRTDFEGGSREDMGNSLKRLATLPDNTVVLPGHYGTTTIGAERKRVFAQFA